MAGNGPPPAAQKRRTNSTKLDQIDHPEFEIPTLPKTYNVVIWVEGVAVTKRLTYLPATRAWWEAWKRSPIADELAEVHWLRLLSVAKLKDRYERDPSPKNASELRLQEAAFGGTPADLRRTGRVVRPSTADDDAAGQDAPVDDLGAARRRRLQAAG